MVFLCMFGVALQVTPSFSTNDQENRSGFPFVTWLIKGTTLVVYVLPPARQIIFSLKKKIIMFLKNYKKFNN